MNIRERAEHIVGLVFAEMSMEGQVAGLTPEVRERMILQTCDELEVDENQRGEAMSDSPRPDKGRPLTPHQVPPPSSFRMADWRILMVSATVFGLLIVAIALYAWIKSLLQ